MNRSDQPPNAHEAGKAGTAERDLAEAVIEKLRQGGGIFVEAVRATRMPMALTDPTLPGNPIVFANQAFLKLTGYRMDEVLGQQPHFMNGRLTDPQDAARFAEALRSDQDDIIETIQYRKDGSRFVATVLLSAFKDADGKVINHFMSWLDVTRRVNAEEEVADLKHVQAELRASEEKYRALFQNIDEGFAIMECVRDQGGRLTDLIYREVNDAFERLTGFKPNPGLRVREIMPAIEAEWFDYYDRVSITGNPEEREDFNVDTSRWFRTNTSRLGGDGSPHLGVVFDDVTQRKRSEASLRESEERQAVLLNLSDALRTEPDADAIAALAIKLLGEALHLDRCYIVAKRPGETIWDVGAEFKAPSLPPMPPELDERGFPEALRLITEQTLVIDDIATQAGVTDTERAGLRALDFGSLVMAVLRKGRAKPDWSLVASFTQPHHWTSSEVKLVEDVAERTWAAIERARSERALRESETKFRAVFETMNEACCLFDLIYDDDGRPVDWIILEANPGYEKQSGLKNVVGRLASEFMPGTEPYWIEMFGRVAETGEGEHIEKWHEPTGRWIHSSTARVGGPGSRRLASVFFDITERKRAEEALRDEQRQQQILLAELQHRVRNTLAVIKSIVRRTAANADSVESLEQHLEGRLNAFARTQAYVTRDPAGSVDLEMIVRDELLAHAERGARNISIEGPKVRLHTKQAETFGLAVHELTSNAIKHGALSGDGNRIDVKWSLKGKGDKCRLQFNWREKLAEAKLEAPSRHGFGTELLKRVISYELDAEPVIEYLPDGLNYKVSIPLPQDPPTH